MCLSSVYAVEGAEKELLCKNVSVASVKDGKLVFTDIMGVSTEVLGDIERIDLMDNFIYVRRKDA